MNCSIPGCNKPKRARGWCEMHYQRWRKHGDPEKKLALCKGASDQLLADFLLSKIAVVDGDGCWLWDGATTNAGYGYWRRFGYAHRIIWRLFMGDIPSGFEVAHRCDNPRCVRPTHLFLATHKENMADMSSKGRGGNQFRTIAGPTGRQASVFGERCPTSKLTQQQVAAIRALWQSGTISQQELAHEFGVSPSNISNIVTGRTWKQIAA